MPTIPHRAGASPTHDSSSIPPLDGTDITRTPYRSFYADPESLHDYRFDDTTYSIGARFRFRAPRSHAAETD